MGPNNASHGKPLDRANGDEHEDKIASKHYHQQNDENNEGQRIENVDDAHKESVGAAAEIAGNGAVSDTDNERDGSGKEADGERDAATN